jgi:hypothetical protein
MDAMPATRSEAKKAWKRTKTVLVKEARKAFKEREIWGMSANGYPVVVSGDGEWAIGFAKRNDTVFGFDVFAYHPELPRGQDNLWPLWLKN